MLYSSLFKQIGRSRKIHIDPRHMVYNVLYITSCRSYGIHGNRSHSLLLSLEGQQDFFSFSDHKATLSISISKSVSVYIYFVALPPIQGGPHPHAAWNGPLARIHLAFLIDCP